MSLRRPRLDPLATRRDVAARLCFEDIVRLQQQAHDPATRAWLVDQDPQAVDFALISLGRIAPNVAFGAELGVVVELQGRGRHAEALESALRVCERVARLRPGRVVDARHRQFWTMLAEAVDAAAALGTREAWARVAWRAKKRFLAVEGFHASKVMLLLSERHLHEGRLREAEHAARLALGADPTWPEPSIWAARLALRGARFHAKRMLRDAIAIDPARRDELLQDPEFTRDDDLVLAMRAAPLRSA